MVLVVFVEIKYITRLTRISFHTVASAGDVESDESPTIGQIEKLTFSEPWEPRLINRQVLQTLSRGHPKVTFTSSEKEISFIGQAHDVRVAMKEVKSMLANAYHQVKIFCKKKKQKTKKKRLE
jgi:hypothetical protein